MCTSSHVDAVNHYDHAVPTDVPHLARGCFVRRYFPSSGMRVRPTGFCSLRGWTTGENLEMLMIRTFCLHFIHGDGFSNSHQKECGHGKVK
jgi:hypothetical protein